MSKTKCQSYHGENLKKKVCFLTSRHEPWCFRIFYKEALSLRRACYAVHIITSTGYVRQVKAGITVHGFSLHGVVPYKFKINEILTRLTFIYLGVKARADIYHCHSPELLLVAYIIKLVQRLLFRKKVAIIHEIRDFYLHEAFLDSHLGWRERLKLSLQAWWDKMIHRKFDYIIGVEESKVERPLSYGIDPRKIATVENYVSLDLFHERRKKFDATEFVLAYSGGLSFLRGVDRLAKACVVFGKRVDLRPTLLLIGQFPNKAKEEEEWLVNYCKKNEQFVNLKFLGWVDHLEVPEILADADICFTLFYSKRYEKVLSTNAGPLKLYEYMALGKPIIATNARALERTIQSTQCGLIVDARGGVEAVAEAIEFYFRNPNRLLQDGRNGRLAVERDFNWSIAERKLLQIYRELMHNKCARKNAKE